MPKRYSAEEFFGKAEKPAGKLGKTMTADEFLGSGEDASPYKVAGENAADVLTLGYYPQIVGAATKVVGKLTGTPIDYEQVRDEVELEMRQEEKAHPTAAMAGKIGGLALTAALPIPKANLGRMAGGRIGGSAATAASTGFLADPSTVENRDFNMDQRISNATAGGVLGAGAAAAPVLAGKTLQAAGSVGGKIADVASSAPGLVKKGVEFMLPPLAQKALKLVSASSKLQQKFGAQIEKLMQTDTRKAADLLTRIYTMENKSAE